jgi:hypothetical protein
MRILLIEISVFDLTAPEYVLEIVTSMQAEMRQPLY